MIPSRTLILTLLASATLAGSASAQARTNQARKPDIPAAHMPPAGLCRIWVTGVPPDKQPAPTDCTTALRNKPANGTVVFGEKKADSTIVVPRTLRSQVLPNRLAPPGGLLPGRQPVRRMRAESASVRDSTSRRDSVARRDTSERTRGDTISGGKRY